MKFMHLGRISMPAAAFVIASLSSPLHATTVTWADWTSSTVGTVSGTVALGSGIGVTYAGENDGLLMDYPSWGPSSSFSGGTVSNAPPATNNSVKLTGGTPATETITFSSPIVDPVMAIWSLGQGGVPTSFNFTSAEPFTLEAGGPSNEYGGSSITTSGNSIFGVEGNGVVQFSGTFSQLTFTTPVYENYYAFTVGADSLAGPTGPTGPTGPPTTSPVPEPSSLLLLGSGLASLPLLRRTLRLRGR